jgi:hypothetical protein
MTSTRERSVENVPRRHRGRRAARWVGLGLGITLVAILGYWLLARSGAVPPPPPVSAPTPATSEPVAVAPQPATGADGCLGGSDPSAAILPAQQSAPLSPVGAAEFALVWVRYVGQYPVDPNVDAVLPVVTTAEFHDEAAARLQQVADLSAGDDADMFDFGIKPGAPAQYRVVGGDPGESISLNIAFTREFSSVDGRSAQETSITTVIVTASGGHWVVAANDAPMLSDPSAPITGAPWVSYAGVC